MLATLGLGTASRVRTPPKRSEKGHRDPARRQEMSLEGNPGLPLPALAAASGPPAPRVRCSARLLPPRPPARSGNGQGILGPGARGCPVSPAPAVDPAAAAARPGRRGRSRAGAGRSRCRGYLHLRGGRGGGPGVGERRPGREAGSRRGRAGERESAGRRAGGGPGPEPAASGRRPRSDKAIPAPGERRPPRAPRPAGLRADRLRRGSRPPPVAAPSTGGQRAWLPAPGPRSR